MSGAAFVLPAIAWVRYHATEVAVTTRRVIVKTAIISRKTVEVNPAKVESLQVEPIVGVAGPPRFRKAFIAAQDAARHPGQG